MALARSFGLAGARAVIELNHRHLQAQHVGQENEFLARFVAELADPGEEFNALDPFCLGQLHFAGEGMEMLDQADRDFLQPRIWAVLVTRYDFVCQFRGDQSRHCLRLWLSL